MGAQSGIEIRCPVYGFVPLDEWERDIIEQRPFQRLRRIRQLAWSDLVYPGATHTRFEHSLGVMHMASMLYDAIVERCQDRLRSEFRYDDTGLARARRLVRFAALLHDVGHGPFSHAVERLAPAKPGTGHPWRHEEYSTAIVRRDYKALIEDHPINRNHNFKVEEVAGLIEGSAAPGPAAIWQDLISGQLDADRMDYLLRDSHHAGVEYGKYDWRRILATVTLVNDPETGSPRFGILESGRHAAEALLIARYMMFNQVYFHKTRVILDYHLHEAMTCMLEGGCFPGPEGADLDKYLEWDDWQVYSRLLEGRGGEHGDRLLTREFYRHVHETSEFPDDDEEARVDDVEHKLSDLAPVRREARKSWYKPGPLDVLIGSRAGGGGTRPLSQTSTIMNNMAPSRRIRLYVPPQHREEARRRIDAIQRGPE